jgi:thiol:disulfide interchange protein
MIRLFLLLAWLAALAFGAPASAQLIQPGPHHMKLALAAESRNVPAGGNATLALVMQPEPGWHGYWKNPGDAGAETRIAWTLPSGLRAGPLLYPVPERLLIAGLMNYVYRGPYALLVDVAVPAGLTPGTRLPVRAKVDYLVCTDRICVPESAEIAADLAVGAPAMEGRAEFDLYRAALPKPLGAAARFELKGGRLRLAVPLPASVPLADPYFYPLTDGVAAYAAPQSFSRSGDTLIVETGTGNRAPGTIAGVLKIGAGQGLMVAATPGPVPAAGTPVAGSAPAAPAGSWLLALAAAVLGGLLLNVMPCVFPILSLKALSLARAGESAAGARREALAYTAGIVLVCVGLGAVLLLLRAGGAQAGWAFQLQDPRAILFLLLLVTMIALNLAGLFELPGFGGGDRLARQSGLAGAFWTGALAAFVATPCTGPFMGVALGAALVLPAAEGLAIFAGLGLGLALPFLLIGWVPALRRMMPRPGAWMNRVRRILSVPMFLTALWLGWLLARLAGNPGLALGIVACLAVAAALWWAGRRQGWAALAPAAAAALAAMLLLPAVAAPAGPSAAGVTGAQKFSEARLASLRAAGRPVFVYFTADWCLTCKVNEKAVLERNEAARFFADRHVAVLEGDWTRGDPAIGRFLAREGRSGVPLYLWYAPGKEAQILPQVLTPGTITGLN